MILNQSRKSCDLIVMVFYEHMKFSVFSVFSYQDHSNKANKLFMKYCNMDNTFQIVSSGNKKQIQITINLLLSVLQKVIAMSHSLLIK